MNAYVDTSVIVPIFWEEAATHKVAEFVSRAATILYVSTFASGEFAATISRLWRDRRLTDEHARATLGLFDAWLADDVLLVTVESQIIDDAISLVRRFDLGLRMPDAIHAATCARLDLTLVTLDVQLVRAAATLGIDVMTPA